MVKSKAAMQATRKYESQNYDVVRVLLPAGTKDMIKATGATVNGFIVRAVQAALHDVQATVTDPEHDTTDGN